MEVFSCYDGRNNFIHHITVKVKNIKTKFSVFPRQPVRGRLTMEQCPAAVYVYVYRTVTCPPILRFQASSFFCRTLPRRTGCLRQSIFTARRYASAVYAMTLCLCLCLSVTSRCSTKMAQWIELIFDMDASFHLSYTVL